MIRVGINGFGRIGRLVLKAGMNDPEIDFVGINDLTDAKTLAHLLKYDSTHGRFPGNVQAGDKSINVNGKKIDIFAEKEPEKIPWTDLDVVVESTGFFTTKDLMSRHLAKAKKVLLSAPSKGDDPIKTIVRGVNEHTYKGEKLVSNASCTTNCFALMVKVIEDNYRIVDGVMTTVHSYTNDQRILDAPHFDLRRARSAALNIVPTTTGAEKTVYELMPELKGKLYSNSIRVPTPDGSVCIFSCEIEARPTVQQVNDLFKNASQYHLKEVLEYTEDEIVSSDIIGNPNSCVFDSKLTKWVDDKMLFTVGWYDNEWGYSNRMVDLIKIMGKR